MAGWPAYDTLKKEREPSLRLEHFSGEASLRGVPPTHSLIRVAGFDPFPVAAEFGGAAIVPQHDFRRMDAIGDLERPWLRFGTRISSPGNSRRATFSVKDVTNEKREYSWARKRVSRVPVTPPL